jgi:hypothetical protein
VTSTCDFSRNKYMAMVNIHLTVQLHDRRETPEFKDIHEDEYDCRPSVSTYVRNVTFLI